MPKTLPILTVLLCLFGLSAATSPLKISPTLPPQAKTGKITADTSQSQSQSGLDNFVFYVGRSPHYAWAGTMNGLGRLNLSQFYWDSYHAEDGLGANSFPSLLYLPDRGRLLVHPQRCDVVFQTIYAYYGYGLRISDDEGESWREIDAAPFVGVGACAWRMVEDSGEVYAACWYNGLAHSKDGGDTWATYNIPFVSHPDIPEEFGRDPRLFSVTARNNKIFAGTDYGIYRSQDGGSSWTYLGMPTIPGSGSIGPWIYDLYMDENSVLWAACENPYYPYNQNVWYSGLAYSNDNGQTWRLEANVLQYSLYILTQTSSGHLSGGDFYDWFGTFAGVARRHITESTVTTNLATGKDGLPSEAIDHLFWYGSNTELWAGTQMGVALSRDYGVTWQPYPYSPRTRPLDRESTFAYPNPFSPIRDGLCFMRISISRPARIQLDVHDFSGQLVRHAYDAVRGPEDVIDIGWNGRNGQGDYVANGTYFYLVKVDGKVKARGKITVLQ